MMIATQHNIQCPLFLHGSTDYHTRYIAFGKIPFELFHLDEVSGAFHDQIDIVFSIPRNGGVLFLAREGYQLSINGETTTVFGDLNVLVPCPVDGIVFDEIGGRFDGAEIVDVHYGKERIFPGEAEDEAADAAKSVDGAGHHDGWLDEWMDQIMLMSDTRRFYDTIVRGGRGSRRVWVWRLISTS